MYTFDRGRYWLLTWTTYGTWLPGDARGCVTSVREPGRESRIEHDGPDEPVEPAMPALHAHARSLLKCPPLYLVPAQAAALADQFRETAGVRADWLGGFAIMANHMHLVVGAERHQDDLMRDYKAYGARALNRGWGRTSAGTWWTDGGGSKRHLLGAPAIWRRLRYLLRQPNALAVWLRAEIAEILEVNQDGTKPINRLTKPTKPTKPILTSRGA